MKTILKIFRDDIRSITKSFFALVIVIGIIVLPSLYAWVNIYVSHDPYVNTGKIPVAVASNDPGIHHTDGSYENVADEIKDDLKKDEKIGYVFPKSADEAVEGVRSGKYYAAIIFEDNFTYDMTHFKEALASDEPALTYYTNTKKNAIASKITDTAAQNLLDKINTRYLEAIFDEVFQDSNDLSEEMDGEEAVDEALKELTETRDALHDFNVSIGQMSASTGDVQKSLNNAEKKLDKARRNGKSNLAKAEESLEDAKATIQAIVDQLDPEMKALDEAIAQLNQDIEDIGNATDEEKVKQLVEKARTDAEKVLTTLKNIRALIPDDGRTSAGQIARDTIDIMILQTEEAIRILDKDPTADMEALTSTVKALADLNNTDLIPGVETMIADFERAIRIAKPLLSATDGMLDNIDPVLGSAGGTVTSMDTTFGRLQTVLTDLEERVDEIIKQVEESDVKDRMATLTRLMGGDPDQYSRFFSSLVNVKSHEIYSVANYGAAMTPFYTILAIWVGGVMMVSLLQTGVNRRKFPQISESQGFFGKYLLFFLIGQLQTALVVAGDIFLLDCEPVHPWLMWLSAAFTSMVFVLFIYALVLSFGIVGKTAVVVAMVLQIAGSSGSFPIEILPPIFGKIYKFFPFPYGINAMRETICGLYGNDFIIYLGQLAVFGLFAVLIGLLVRRPFIGVNRYVTEKMEETEVL